MAEKHFTVRRGEQRDLPVLKEMLYEAVCWRPNQPRPPQDEVLRDPHVARYVKGWGRAGDTAIVATAGSHPAGAAWYRLFPPHEPGYGFIDASVPELSVGVSPANREKGIGTALLEALVDAARGEGFGALSLSVEQDNPAARLYERLEFRRLFLVDNSWTMRLEL